MLSLCSSMLKADEVESQPQQPAASQEKSLEDLYPSIPPPPYEPQLKKPGIIVGTGCIMGCI